jgi:hypothetical protein
VAYIPLSCSVFIESILSMLVFNSIQLVTIFAAGPFVIQFLVSHPNPLAQTLGWVASIGYVCLYIWLIFLVWCGLSPAARR